MKKFRKEKILLPAGTLVLREVEKRDAKALNKIVNEPEVNKFVLLPPPVPLKSTLDRIREKRGGAKWVAAELDGTVVGSVELRPKKGRESHVAGFGISFGKAGRGTGAAAVALQELFKYARQCGVKIIFGSCFEDNPRARKFYEKIGFREVAVLKGHLKRGSKYGGTVLIEKRL